MKGSIATRNFWGNNFANLRQKKKQTLVATCKPQNNKMEPVFCFFFTDGISEGADSHPRQWISTQSKSWQVLRKGGIKKRRRRRKLGAKKEPFCPYRVIWAVTEKNPISHHSFVPSSSCLFFVFFFIGSFLFFIRRMNVNYSCLFFIRNLLTPQMEIWPILVSSSSGFHSSSFLEWMWTCLVSCSSGEVLLFCNSPNEMWTILVSPFIHRMKCELFLSLLSFTEWMWAILVSSSSGVRSSSSSFAEWMWTILVSFFIISSLLFFIRRMNGDFELLPR